MATCIVVSYKYQETRIDYTLAVVMALVLATQMISCCSARPSGPRRAEASTTWFPKGTMVFAGIALCVIWYAIKKEHRPAIKPG
jgi:hypothetical protein